MTARRLATFALFLTLVLAACAPAALTVDKSSSGSGGDGTTTDGFYVAQVVAATPSWPMPPPAAPSTC